MRLIKSCKGAISIFQCIIFMALLLLAGVIIDAARIAVAERRVQNALNTAVRSVLADYNADMIEDYSIFGVDTKSYENKAEEKFNSYFHQNLAERNPDFRLVSYEICEDAGASYLKGSNSLLRGYSFRNQILQYMKYKAPLTVTQNIIEKFKSSGLSGKVKFANSEREVRAKWKLLKNQIDNVNKLVTDVKESAGRDPADLKNYRQKLQEALELNEHIASMLQAYDEEKMKSDAVATAVDRDETGVKSANISTSRVSFEGLQAASSSLKSRITANIESLDGIISQIEGLQLTISRLGSEADTLRTQIKDLKNSINKKKGKNSTHNVEKQIAELKARLDELNKRISEYSRRLGEIQSNFKFADMNKLPIEGANISKRENDPELEKKAKELINKLVKDIGVYHPNIDTERLIDRQEFETYGTEVNGQDMQSKLEGMNGVLGEAEAETENKNVLGFMQQLVGALADTGESGLEKLYITEYIMGRFSYFTAQAERGHFFENGEVEYILWGGNSWYENVTKTIKSIWLMRFAINAVDTFAVSSVPEPVTRLINALTQGFILSCKDMMDLCRGKKINICPSIKSSIKVSYADHLRIFLLLASSTEAGEKNKLNNVRQLMQINIKELDDGFALKNYNAMLHAKVKVKINLWLLPVFKLDYMGFKNFDGSSYVIEKEAHMGY